MIKKRIINAFRQTFGIDICEKTLFFRDTGIDGGDGYTFIEMMEKEFQVDMSTFIFSDYFFEEAEILGGGCFSIIFFGRRLKGKSFRLDHLVKVVSNGAWFSPIR